MKTLISLAVVQTALLIALLYVVLNPPAPPRVPALQRTAAASPVSKANEVQSAQPGASPALTAGELRLIVRQEVAALLNSMPAASPAPDEASVDPVSPAEYQQRLELANQQLEYYISQGEISRTQMADLQANIARLDPESRRHMLSLLSRAINSGELDGHF